MIKKPTDIFPELIYPIQYPSNETETSVFNYLLHFRLNRSNNNELENYLRQDFKRFIYTLNLLPSDQSKSKILEIGANPYFTSILLKKFTYHDLYFTNFFGGNTKKNTQIQENSRTKERFIFEYVNHNIETEDIPFAEKFDTVFFCEVLEHLTNDPLAAILRVKKALRQNGTLILTTPNVNRLENISKMISGTNIYDPYSGYGVYGRHNREYNKHELFLLLNHCGFEIELMFSSDVHENYSNDYFPVKKFYKNILDIKNRANDLGQYIFLRARNSSPAKTCKPTWLFRSYPNKEMCG